MPSFLQTSDWFLFFPTSCIDEVISIAGKPNRFGHTETEGNRRRTQFVLGLRRFVLEASLPPVLCYSHLLL